MSATKSRRPTPRRLVTATVILLAAASLAAISSWWLRAPQALAPPQMDLSNVDRAVRRAVESARTAILDRPDSAEAWGKLGMILMAHGLPVTASTACLTQAERLDPRQPRWPYLEAKAVLATDPDMALQKLQRTVELCDSVPDVPRLLLGELLLDRGRLEEAGEHLRRVVQKHPANGRGWLDLGRLANDEDKLTEGITDLQHCLSDEHTRKAAHLLLAQIYERQGNSQAAADSLRKAEAFPNDLAWPDPFQDEVDQQQVGKQALLAHADELIHRGRYADALRLLRRTIQEYPDSAWAWVMTGRADLGNNDLPKAEQALHKATELGPDIPEAHYYLGVALILQKKYPASTDSFRKATQLKPDFALAYYNLGHSLKEQGDDTGAIAAFRTAINCKPDEGRAHFNLARLLVKQGQRDKALVHLQHAVRLNPADPAAKKLLEQVEKQAPPPGGS